MEFVGSPGGFILGLIAYAILAWIACVIAFESQQASLRKAKKAREATILKGEVVPDDGLPRRRGVFVAWFMAVILIGGSVGNAFTYFITSGMNQAPVARLNDVTSQFGLKSGVKYPLVLGARLGGTSLDIQGGGRWFSVQSRPDSALSVDFTDGEQSWILQLPVSGLTFRQTTTGTPSVTLQLANANSMFYGNAEWVVAHSGECVESWKTWVLTCDRQIAHKLVVAPDVLRDGLAPLVQKYFQSAVIELTPEMYAQVLGKTA